MGARSWICLLVVVLLVGLPPVVRAAETEFTLQLRWTHQFQFAGYYMALEKGFYREAGLAVELIEGGPHALEPVADLLQGKVDFAVSNSGVVIKHMAGEPVVALAAIAQTSPIVWMVLADSGIHSPLDLAGKRLMLMPPPESAELLAMLLREGIEFDQLDLIRTSLDLDDLIEGRIDAYDAYSTNEPWYLERTGIDYRLIRPRDYGVNFYSDVLVTRKSLIERYPAEVDAFVDASLRGWRYALENIEESVQLIHRRYAPDKSLDHLRFEAEQLRELIMPDLVTLGHMNPGRWQTIADTYRELGMASGPLDLEVFIHAGRQPQDLSWLYRTTAATLAALVLLGLLVLYFARMNRRLVLEASRRQMVEAELRNKQEELHRLARTDPLTGLWNRLKFEEVAAAEIRRARRYAYSLAMVFLDLDHFKEINDRYGHTHGDRVLREVAQCIGQVLRESDFICRWGGEEFLILAPHVDDQSAVELAEKVRARVSDCTVPQGKRLTVSLGVAILDNGDRLEDLMRKADKSLYAAKARGRNRVEMWVPDGRSSSIPAD